MRRDHRLMLVIVALAFASACNLLGGRTVFPAPETPTPGPVSIATDTPEPTTVPATPTIEEPTVEATPIVATDVALIYHNGDIITMDDEQSTAQAIAISKGKILAVGSNDDILALQTDSTQVIDLEGRAVIPGFVDPHTHLFNDAHHWDLDLDDIQQLAIESGITTAANLFTTPEFMAEMQAYAAEGRLRIRTSLYLIATTNCGEPVGPWYLNIEPNREPGGMLWISGVKVFTDGGTCGGPAFTYDHPAFGMGNLWMTQSDLDLLLIEANEAGLQVAIHALGDRAIDQALSAIETALDGGPNTPRFRIEHNAVIRPDQLARYGEVDPVTLIFGTFPSCGPAFAESPPEYQDWEWRWRDLVDANPDLHIAWHGDDPWIAPLSPLLDLYSLATPFEAGSEDGTVACPDATHIGNKTLSVEEALPMMTIEGAYALFREAEVGSLRRGKFADLLILSDNPLTIPAESIRDIDILMTMIGGNTEYCLTGNEILCP